MTGQSESKTAPHNGNGALDITLGLKRLGGDKNLYCEIVEDFAKLYADFPSRFLLALEDGGSAPVLIAHTLKGAAGNISATVLQNLAERLERACNRQEDRDTILKLLKQVDTALQKVLEFSPASL